MRKTIATACVLGLFLTVASGAAFAAEWTQLGQKIVDYRTNPLTIAVKSDAAWKQLRLEVKSYPIDLLKVTVTFKDGTTFEATPNAYVAAGKSTKVIDLPEAKPIAKIDLTYHNGSNEKLPIVCVLATT
jgi:hypothetical protein